MSAEIEALEKNNTWSLVKCPAGQPIVDCRWVYKAKVNPDGSSKLKARLVARGFSQIYGENYCETYAPVVKSSTIRLLIATAVNSGMKIEQLDVRNAYVKSDLRESVYMQQPPGFWRGEGLVCKLNKSLYGLKQAGHEWSQCLSEFLVRDMQFNRLKSDPCVYTRGVGADKLIISVYVDDLLIFCRQEQLIRRFKAKFNERFEIEDLGDCKKIIGIEVLQQEGGAVSIHQMQFLDDLLERYNMTDCRSAKTPLNSTLELCCGEPTCDGCERADGKLYRGMIGRLLYLAGSTRPDISFAVSSLSRFLVNPHAQHLKAAKHLLRYLKGTRELRITYEPSRENLFCHSDADYGNCKMDRKSYTGFLLILAGAPIAWEARKQPTVALSSTEAEYMAITSAAKEVMFCRQVLLEMGESTSEEPIQMFSDNLSAISISKNVGFSARTKHIDVRHHYIRELIQKGFVSLHHRGTADMLADVCTKALGPIKHEMNVRRMFKEIRIAD